MVPSENQRAPAFSDIFINFKCTACREHFPLFLSHCEAAGWDTSRFVERRGPYRVQYEVAVQEAGNMQYDLAVQDAGDRQYSEAVQDRQDNEAVQEDGGRQYDAAGGPKVSKGSDRKGVKGRKGA